ncbi:MAG: nucleotidyltransferase [Methanobacteriota archaeon]
MYYEDVFSKFNQKKARYVIVGGLAVNLHGVPKMTADLDIMADLSKENLLRLIEAVTELGYLPRKEKKMHVFTFWHPSKPYQQIDIFIENPIDFDAAYKSREIVKAGGLEIPLISLDHLIILKKISARKQDLSDIETLKKVKKLKEGKYEEKRL